MDIIGTIRPREVCDTGIDVAEMQRLSLDKQYMQFAVDHKDERGDYPLCLFGDGTMFLNFPGEPTIILDRAETVRLYTFLHGPHVKELMIGIIRASLVEAGHEQLIDELMAMPDEYKQAVLSAFGRAEKPAFLDAAKPPTA